MQNAPNANIKLSTMRLNVRREISRATSTSHRSLFIKTMDADSTAMSVPAPMAMPTLALGTCQESHVFASMIQTDLGECRRVVDAVADHSYDLAGCLQRFHFIGLVFGQNIGKYLDRLDLKSDIT